MNYQHLTPVYGTIISAETASGDRQNQLLALHTVDGPVNFVVSPDTYIVNNIAPMIGMEIVGFYNSSFPVPLIYPPQYHASFLVPVIPYYYVMVDYFDDHLLAASGNLQLNLSPDTTIVDSNGQPFRGDPGNHILVVYYNQTTRSRPPQTTPKQVIVIEKK